MAIELSPEEKEKLHEVLCSKGDTLVKELHADMRALRETELKIVPLFFQVSAFILAGNVALSSGKDISLFVIVWTGVLSIAILCGFWVQICRRIDHDHTSYSYLSERIKFIRSEWGVDCLYKSDDFGSGSGYSRNKWLVSWAGGGVVLILIGILLVKIACNRCHH